MVASKVLLAGLFAAVVSAQTSSTCTPYSAPAGACPTAYDSCCAFLCAEAQVPFGICQPTDGTGEFATCTACASGTATAVTTTTTTTDTATGNATDTITGTDARSTSTTTLTSTTTICISGNTTSYTILPTPTYISGASEAYMVLNGVLALGLVCAVFGV
ncbi:uncharacterized protein DFL_000472 [Arthrobotrys flagrans]|uniref:Uncharacterized protein n=1 Tax=Arthrobotrys flagrans TaxID=97331 RepID=A0A437ADV5_ARTFL|nr:hypothetical protein DFL_000472 [Arthrobotrys flagrans]